MGALCIIGFIIYAIYKLAEEHSWDNCNAHDVDWSKMSRESSFISAKEKEKRYKSGYYNKK